MHGAAQLAARVLENSRRPARQRPGRTRDSLQIEQDRDQKREDAQTFGKRRADDGVGELAGGGRRITQRAIDEIAEIMPTPIAAAPVPIAARPAPTS